MRELHPHLSDKWEDIGIELEIDDRELKQIKTNNAGIGTKDCLREMLRV